MRIVRKFREGHLQRRTYANGESTQTVPRVKFMLREATVIAEEHFFPSVRNGCDATAIVRNRSKRKKFYEVIVISINNTKVRQRVSMQRILETNV